MATLLFITFAVLLLLGMPVAFSIALSALTVLLAGGVKPLMVVQRMFTAQDSFSLIAVPFFILAGDLMSKGRVPYTLKHREAHAGAGSWRSCLRTHCGSDARDRR